MGIFAWGGGTNDVVHSVINSVVTVDVSVGVMGVVEVGEVEVDV